MIPFEFEKLIPSLLIQAATGLVLSFFIDPEIAAGAVICVYAGTAIGWWLRTKRVNEDYILLPKGTLDDDPS